MKSRFVLLLSIICLLACEPRGVDYLADDAIYVQEQEFFDEFNQLTSTEIEGTQLKIRCHYGIRNIRDLECNYQGLEDQSGARIDRQQIPLREIRESLEIRRQRILKFLKTYERPFRVRYKNGDLKMISIKDSGLLQLKNTLKMIDVVLKSLPTQSPTEQPAQLPPPELDDLKV